MANISAETLDFLFENKFRDSKEWFDEHKDAYQELVVTPFRSLAAALAPAMLELDDRLVTDPRKVVSRIRRDTRFTHDKSIYRANLWIHFKQSKLFCTDPPGIYVDISGSGFKYGCGFYQASPKYMQKLREMVLENTPAFQAAQQALQKQHVFRLNGDLYKRTKFPDQPENLRLWLDRKGISFNAESKDFDLMFSDGLADKLIKDFKLMKPLYLFLLAVSQDLIEKKGQ